MRIYTVIQGEGLLDIIVSTSLILIAIFIIGMALIIRLNRRKLNRTSLIEGMIDYLVFHTFLSRGIFKYKNFNVALRIIKFLVILFLMGIVIVIIAL